MVLYTLTFMCIAWCGLLTFCLFEMKKLDRAAEKKRKETKEPKTSPLQVGWVTPDLPPEPIVRKKRRNADDNAMKLERPDL